MVAQTHYLPGTRLPVRAQLTAILRCIFSFVEVWRPTEHRMKCISAMTYDRLAIEALMWVFRACVYVGSRLVVPERDGCR